MYRSSKYKVSFAAQIYHATHRQGIAKGDLCNLGEWPLGFLNPPMWLCTSNYRVLSRHLLIGTGGVVELIIVVAVIFF